MGKLYDELMTKVPEGMAMTIAAGTLASIVTVNVLLRYTKSFKRDAVNSTFNDTLTATTSILSNKDSVLQRGEVKSSIEEYEGLFDGARKDVGSLQTEDSIKKRESEYQTMVNSFYNLVTDFYEYGWGQSFHFAPRLKGETFLESIKRAEYYLALRASIGPNSKCLDVGCGVGGPMRNIGLFTGADITGVTINEYQVKVGNEYCKQKGLGDRCRLIQGDFQTLKDMFEAEKFDVAYQIEATCHSPDRVHTFSGIAHTLKKGGLFTGYEWAVLPERGFDKNNADHVRIKEGIEVGNGLPTLATAEEIVKSLEDSGFEVLDYYDANRNVHSGHEIPWYDTLNGKFSLSGFRMTYLGRVCTHAMLNMLEFLYIAPKGTVRVSALLNATAIDLVDGGKQEIFTPSFFFLARKK